MGCPEWPLHGQVGHMSSLRVLAVSLCSLMWACINVPEITVVPDPPDAGDVRPVVTLTLSRTATHADVDVRVSVTELVPESVELFVDGVSVAVLLPPEYSLRWSTQSLSEGPHAFSARVSLGDRVYTSGLRTLVVDRTMPRVVSQLPRTGAQDVSVHAPIQAVFSEALDPTSLSAESVRLLVNQAEVAAELRLSADGTLLTLAPVEQLPVDADVSVSLSSSVADMAGNPLDVVAFTWQWTVPRHLLYGGPLSASSPEGPNVSIFSAALDEDGRPIVAFVDGVAPSNYGVHIMRWSGTTWERLGDVLGGGEEELVIKACSLWTTPTGEIFVSWNSEMGDGNPSIHVHHWNEGRWSPLGAPVRPLESDAKIVSFGFAVNPRQERLLVVLERAPGASPSLYVVRWNEGRWEALSGASELLHPGAIYSGFNWVLDSMGRLVFVWASQTEEWGAATTHARRWSGAHWETRYAAGGGAAAVPVVSTLDAADRLVVGSVAQSAGAGRRPYITRLGGVSGVEVLSANVEGMYPGETDARVEVFDFDPDGMLVSLVSEPEVAGGPVNHYVRRWDETSWVTVGAPVLPRPGTKPVGTARFFMTGTERWVLVRIEESDGTPNQRHLNVYRPNN